MGSFWKKINEFMENKLKYCVYWNGSSVLYIDNEKSKTYYDCDYGYCNSELYVLWKVDDVINYVIAKEFPETYSTCNIKEIIQ